MGVILINPFEVPAGREEFLTGWTEAADYMRRQAGFEGSRLHRALGAEARFGFINIAGWESPRHFQAAVTTPEFADMTRGGPPGNPALYEVVRTIEAGHS